jgi:TonB family protein
MNTLSANNALARGAEKSALWSSLGMAVAVEALVVAALFVWMATRELPPRTVALPIEIENTPKIDQPEPPKVQPPLPKPPKIEPKPLKEPPKVQTPTPPQPVPEPVVQAPSVAVPNAFTQVATPPPPPPPPPVESKPLGPSDEYIAKVRAAVQAAFSYPMAAAEMGLHGRARVGFNLRNTTASDVKIINGSGLGLIDRAALAAVQKAVYPNPPSEQKDKTNYCEVWIDFKP